MDVLEAIHTRRTIFKFKPGSVPRDVIEKVFEAGLWAPNHHLTEPWRFVVLGEETKETLAQRYSEIQEAKAAEGESDEAKKALKDAGYAKFMSKPTIVAVACLQDGDDIKKREDYAAACCAMQNVQLAAWAEGVGMQWSTGPITLEERPPTIAERNLPDPVTPERQRFPSYHTSRYPVAVSGMRSSGGGSLGINFFIPIAEGLEALNIKLDRV